MTLSTEALERIEIDAWRDYCAAAPPVLAQAVGLETVECAGPPCSLARSRMVNWLAMGRRSRGGQLTFT